MMYAGGVWLGTLLVLGWVSRTAAVTAAEMKTHMTTTFNTYSTRVRPVTNDQSAVVTVTLDLHLIGINNFDSAEQKLESTAYLEITWTDQELMNSWQNAAIENILVPQQDIWLPDLALQNGFESLTGLGNKYLLAKVSKTGTVTWKPYQVFESACTVDVTFFPFDKTTCELKFVICSNPSTLVTAQKGTVGLDMSLYEVNSEWSVLKSTSSNFVTNTASGVTFSLEMKRKPLFYLLNILVPVILLAVLNAFVFVLPASSGEKIGFSVTAFLAFAVFLTIISAELPQNSDKLSTFAAYLFLMTFLSTLIVLITIVELRLFARDAEQPIPGCLQAVTRCVRRIECTGCCKKNEGYIRGIPVSEAKRHLAEDVTWQDVVDSLDFVFFWVFFLLTVLITVACCVIAALGAFES